MAVDRGLPVYSEGLRVLTDGLRLMGSDGKPPREKVIKSAGVVLWSLPLTASLVADPGMVPPTTRRSMTLLWRAKPDGTAIR
jgi:hypothetical protein